MSSPLILSHDVNNATLSAELWPLIANREVLAVNQAYYGDSGGVFYASNQTVQLDDIEGWQAYPGESNHPPTAQVHVPTFQFLSKRQSYNGTKVAVLLLNSLKETAQLTLLLERIPGITCLYGCRIRDLWRHETLGVFGQSWSVTVGPHDAAFITLEALPATTSEYQDESHDRDDAHPSFAISFFVTVLVVAISTLCLLRAAVRTLRGGSKRFEYSQIDGSDAQHAVEMETMQPHSHFS